MRTSRLRIGATIAAAALLLTACSSGTPSDDSSGSDVEGGPIKIGYALPLTGFSSGLASPSVDVARAWAEWVNAEGGIDGHPVEVIVKDTAATPTTALSVVKNLVEQDDVAAILFTDAVSESGVKDYLAGSDIAVLEGLSYDPTMFSALPNFFTTVTTNRYDLSAYAISAAAVGASTIGAVVCAEAPPCALVGDVTDQIAPSLDLEYLGLLKASASQPNFTAECLNFIQKDVDWIATALESSTAARFITDCQQQGYEGGFGSVGGLVSADILDEVPGAQHAGTIPSFPWWVDDEPVTKYREVLEQYAPDASYAGVYQTAAWTALEMFRTAVTGSAADGLTRAQVIEAYGTVADETLDGLLPEPVTYTDGEPAPALSCYWIYSYVGGSGDFQALQEGPVGNGVDTDLASSCYDGPEFTTG